MQILMHFPEMLQLLGQRQRATKLQLFISSYQAVPEKTHLGKPKEEGLGTSCSLDLAPKQCHTKKHFSGCHAGMEGVWGITTRCVEIAPNNDNFSRTSHSNIVWGNTSPCQDLPCSKLKSRKRNSCSTQPCANKPCPTTSRELPGSAESKQSQSRAPVSTRSRHLTLAPPTAATEFCLEASKCRLECGFKGIWKIKAS